MPEEKLYTYVIVRDDLEMPAGKLASQASHASRLSLLHFIRDNPHRLAEFIDSNVAGSMVVLRAKNLAALEKAHLQATNAGLPTAMFTDSGHVLLPHFDGSPVTTAVAIGPARREDMRPMTKKFQVVK
ncbi:peptidyl-tRNA hydrolase [Gluconobacter cerinus]